MKKILSLLILFLLLIIPKDVYAINEVNIYLFYSETCSICEQERVYLQALKQDRYPNIRVYSYEINDTYNYQLMEEAKKLFNESGTGVPFTVIGDKPIYGFTQGLKGTFQKYVYYYSKNKYDNKLGKKLEITYRNDLEGDVKEYKENADYKIEETSGNERIVTTNNSDLLQKYKSSLILIILGLVLFIIYLILTIKEKRTNI